MNEELRRSLTQVAIYDRGCVGKRMGARSALPVIEIGVYSAAASELDNLNTELSEDDRDLCTAAATYFRTVLLSAGKRAFEWVAVNGRAYDCHVGAGLDYQGVETLINAYLSIEVFEHERDEWVKRLSNWVVAAKNEVTTQFDRK